jgi:hypothetical protein
MDTSLLAYPCAPHGITDTHKEQPATTCSHSSTQRLTFLNSLASRPERTTHEH